MELVENLSVNLLFLLLPIFLYQLLEIKIRKHQKLFITVASGLTIIFSMSFPITLENYIFDLRQIPLILSGIYGGVTPLFFSFFVLIGYRFYLGGEGAIVALYIVLILLVIVLMVILLVRDRNNKIQRIISAVGLAVIGSLITISVFSFSTETTLKEYMQFLVTLAIVQSLGMMILSIFIETIISNKSMQEKLIRAERIQSVSELAASISHEVRNPLTVVRGFIQVFNQSDLSPDKRKEYMDLTLQELDRAESIISSYLQFARPNLEDIRRLNIYEELNAIVEMMKPFAIKNGVTLETHISNNSKLWILGDSGLFRQSLINIIKNAIEAIPTKGTVRVVVSTMGDNITIQINDTGVGMSKEQIRRLGEPYFTTKEKGTGLGLMVAFSSIKKMNGDIDIQSDVGKGTSFIITLPKAV